MKTWGGDFPHIPADSESSRVTFPETVYAVGLYVWLIILHGF